MSKTIKELLALIVLVLIVWLLPEEAAALGLVGAAAVAL